MADGAIGALGHDVLAPVTHPYSTGLAFVRVGLPVDVNLAAIVKSDHVRIAVESGETQRM